jgi:hypothetical protein
LQASLHAVDGGTRQPQKSPAFAAMVGRKGLLDIPTDLRSGILNLKAHPAIEIQ